MKPFSPPNNSFGEHVLLQRDVVADAVTHRSKGLVQAGVCVRQNAIQFGSEHKDRIQYLPVFSRRGQVTLSQRQCSNIYQPILHHDRSHVGTEHVENSSPENEEACRLSLQLRFQDILRRCPSLNATENGT
jgi:hypothetical protein